MVLDDIWKWELAMTVYSYNNFFKFPMGHALRQENIYKTLSCVTHIFLDSKHQQTQTNCLPIKWKSQHQALS